MTYLEIQASSKYTKLEKWLRRYNEQQVDRLRARYGYKVGDDTATTTVDIDTWAYGPLVKLTRRDASDEVEPPVTDNALSRTVVLAGYVPWGFRPDHAYDSEDGGWLWYLRPIDDVLDMEVNEYTVTDGEGFLRDSNDDLVTFDTKAQAEAVAEQSDEAVKPVME